MDKYFNKAGNLDDSGFKPAGNLDDSGFKFAGNLDDGGFKPAGNLDDNGFKPAGNLEDSGFKPAGNLEEDNGFKFSEPKTVTADEIKSYIASVQSGIKTDGMVSGGGVTFVTFDELKDMVNNGYNIIKANYFEQMKMIEVEFDVPINNKTR